METFTEKPWHSLPEAEVSASLETDPERGLSAEESRRRLERFGRNALPERQAAGPLRRFAEQFHQPLVWILLVAVAATAALGEFVDSIVIFLVVLVNACVGFIQEAKAIRALEALAKTLSIHATVVRDGDRQVISAEELSVGDLVVLSAGDKVPADLRLLRMRELRIDESALTGESVAAHKARSVSEPHAALGDRHNMAFASTLVIFGQGAGIVVSTGAGTQVGRISELIEGADNLQTPLTRKIAEFSRWLLYVIVALALGTFLLGTARGQAPLEMLMAAVALAVGAIPEGMPAAVTIILAIGVNRMAGRRAIVRRLPAVETLGSTTVICSDKTGTLTENQMTVSDVATVDAHFSVSGAGYDPKGTIEGTSEATAAVDSLALRECLLGGVLCNDAKLVRSQDAWHIEGDPTEGALIVAARKHGLFEDAVEAEQPRLDLIPFESEHRYMATLHDVDGWRRAYVKGATEAIAARSVDALNASGALVPLDPQRLDTLADEMAARGLRVLAIARRDLPEHTEAIGHSDVASGLTFLGLTGMIDPPRPEAIHAVQTCQKAGITVKMITGDHALTASAIARQLGLTRDSDGPPLLGIAMQDMSDSVLAERVERTAVFARVSPEQKLRLVRALQANGHVVAMTGDGVNDAPALRQADIGVAMGLGGTEVAKEASDIVLTDDNFATIAAAAEEGRGVFDNLSKFIVWTLPTNIGEGLVILVAIVANVTLPILPVQILWINMSTGVLLGMTLAFEPKESEIMTRKPRSPSEPIMNSAVVQRVILVGLLLLLGSFGLYEYELSRGRSLAEARTVAVNVFVAVEAFYLFNCRSLKRSVFTLGFWSNPWVIGGILSMFAFQLAFTYVPLMNSVFQSAPIGIDAWARVFLVGILAFFIVGFEKWMRRRFEASHGSRLSTPTDAASR